jgi:hypothetical protein
VHATKLLALSLAIILSPKVAMSDVVGPMGHSRAGTGASATGTEHHRIGGQQGTKVPSPDSAGRRSGLAWTKPSTAKIKGRWGSPRRLTLVSRSSSKALATLCQALGGPLTWLSTRSCSNWSGVSGREKR